MQVQASQMSKFPAAAMPLPAKSGAPVGTQMSLRKGRELFAEGEEAEYFYKVVSGAIRSYKLLSDGRRQIDAFHLPGDFFGLEVGDTHRFSVEAVCAAEVRAFRRARLPALSQADPGFGEEIMAAVLTSL